MEENVYLIAEQGQLEEKLQLHEKYRKTERSKTNYIVTIEKTKQELAQLKQHQATFLDADQKEELLKKQKEDLEDKIAKGLKKLQRCKVQIQKQEECERLK